jgi:hypothetical protein
VVCARLVYWRGMALLSVAIAAWYLLMNSGYVYWDGGWSVGPRHVTAMSPFLCVLFAPLWQRCGPATRLIAGVLLVPLHSDYDSLAVSG